MKRQIPRKIATFSSTVVMMTASVALVTVTPANAVSCGSHTGLLTYVAHTLPQSISHNGPRVVRLQLVQIRSNDYTHAFLTGAGGTGVQRGDSVWVEWRRTASSPWEKCPASTAATDAQTSIRSQDAYNKNHPMRACLSYWATPSYRNTVCTPSWADDD